MNSSNNLPENENRLEALFQQKEAEFQENLYKSWAMAERDSTYEAVQQIAIALINQGTFASGVVDQAISIHEEIRNYSKKYQLKHETTLSEQND